MFQGFKCDSITIRVLITLTVCRFSPATPRLTDRHGWPEAHGGRRSREDGTEDPEEEGRRTGPLPLVSCHFTSTFTLQTERIGWSKIHLISQDFVEEITVFHSFI